MTSIKPRMNQGSRLLSNEENSILFRLIPDGCQAVSTCVVQLVLTEPPHHRSWRIVGTGALCFIKNNQLQSFFMEFFNLTLGLSVWEQELYLELDYYLADNRFHTFEADTCLVGFNFANEGEAWDFSDVVLNKLAILRKQYARQSSIPAHSGKESRTSLDGLPSHSNRHVPLAEPPKKIIAPPIPISAQPVHLHQKPAIQRNETINTRKGTVSKKSKKQRLTKDSVSAPIHSTFRHIGHIGFDPNKGFQYDQSDPTMLELFQRAGIDISSVSADDAKFVYGYVEDKFGGAAGVRARAANSIKRRPINDPDARSDNRGFAPPPPPSATVHRNDPTGGRMVTGNDASQRPLPPVPPNREGSLPPPPARGGYPSPQLPRSGPPRQDAVAPPPPPSVAPAQLGEQQVNGGFLPSGGETVSHDRTLVLNDIRSGTTRLKPAETRDGSRSPAPTNTRDQLMLDIKSQSGRLKPALFTEPSSREDEPLDGMAAALARALAARRGAIEVQDEDPETDDEWEA